MLAAAIDGRTSGRLTRQNAAAGLAPSSRAASSRSRGTLRNALRRTRKASGSEQRVGKPEAGPEGAVVDAEADRQRRQRDRERHRRKHPGDDQRAVETAVDARLPRRRPRRRQRDRQRRRHRERSHQHAECEAAAQVDGVGQQADVLEGQGPRHPRRRPREALALGRERLLQHEAEWQEIRRRHGQSDQQREPFHGAVPRRTSGSVSTTLRSASRVDAAAAAPSFP